MKRKIALALAAGGTALAILPLFAAFEAHVINVTATIENALSVPIEQTGLTFGEVFPQEVVVLPFDINLSESFLADANVNADQVQYMIRQKPKCGLPVPGTDPVQYSAFAQSSEDANGNFVCPGNADTDTDGDGTADTDTDGPGYVALPLLCPYLSKNQVDGTGDTIPSDGLAGISSFHGTTATSTWTLATTIATQVFGSLTKPNDPSDTWEIDLHTPCFAGQCAQDWATFVTTANPGANPTAYEAPAWAEHQQFGCDLWVEATAIPQVVPTP